MTVGIQHSSPKVWTPVGARSSASANLLWTLRMPIAARFVVQGHTPMENADLPDTDRKTISCFPSAPVASHST